MKITRIIAATLIVFNAALGIYLFCSKERTAYIDYNTVYNNCRLKTDLEEDLKRVTESRKSELDSLKLQLTFLSQSISSGKADQQKLDEFEDQKNRFLTMQQRYEEENGNLKETYFNQIRKEINEKARLYAENKGYDYFFSATGDGSLMYASESEDVTKDFQVFLDKK